MRYVELHCHSAYSFLDGASQPEELAARAAELGYEALALTDHDGVYGSLEFAHAAKAFGIRPITGAEVTLDGGSHVTLLVETPKGYANLCRLLTEAHAGTRPKPGDEPLPPALPLERLLEQNDGLVCLSGCARHGLAVRDPNAAARVAAAFGADRFYVELQRPYERGDARRNAAPARARPRPRRRRPSPPATSTPTTSGAPPLQDALVAIRCRTSLDGCEQERRGNHEAVLLAPEDAARALPRRPRRRPPHRRARRRADLRPDRGARLPLPRLLGRLRDPGRPARAGSACGSSTSATAARAAAGGRQPGCERSSP